MDNATPCQACAARMDYINSLHDLVLAQRIALANGSACLAAQGRAIKKASDRVSQTGKELDAIKQVGAGIEHQAERPINSKEEA